MKMLIPIISLILFTFSIMSCSERETLYDEQSSLDYNQFKAGKNTNDSLQAVTPDKTDLEHDPPVKDGHDWIVKP